jgi:hypothetical protein
MACHNLCTNNHPPPNFRALLGLGLTFIPTPQYSHSKHEVSGWTDRFRADIYTKCFMAHQQSPIPRLFTRTSWEPPIKTIHRGLVIRVKEFTTKLVNRFQRKKARSNLLPFQRTILAKLRASKQHIVLPADKNLGPCIIERDKYISRALNDHLLHSTTYRSLSPTQAAWHIQQLKQQVKYFIDRYKKHLLPEDIKFLERTSTVNDPYAKFYLTAKVHKKPWQTRPIVSIDGSLLHGLGRWVDKVLQPFAQNTKAFTRSSTTLKDELMTLSLPPNALLCTMDATSMYTNIDTKHGIRTTRAYVDAHPNLATEHERQAVLEALEIVMTNNIFQFGDTFWLQLDGTAMGVSPSCVYATIYFAAFEEKLQQQYPEIIFFRRYIDDIFIIWQPLSRNDNERWQAFQKEINTFGKLKWEFTARSYETNFLDLQITIRGNGTISTCLFEKQQNLYLYLPSTSCHPPGNLRSLISGMIYRTLRLTSEVPKQKQELHRLYHRLAARGYRRSLIQNSINATYRRLSAARAHTTSKPKTNMARICLFHMTYHPQDMKSYEIQQIFQNTVLAPPYRTPLPELCNHRQHPIGIDQLLIAYHRTPNLGNLLSPRVLKASDGPLVSSFLTRS